MYYTKIDLVSFVKNVILELGIDIPSDQKIDDAMATVFGVQEDTDALQTSDLVFRYKNILSKGIDEIVDNANSSSFLPFKEDEIPDEYLEIEIVFDENALFSDIHEPSFLWPDEDDYDGFWHEEIKFIDRLDGWTETDDPVDILRWEQNFDLYGREEDKLPYGYGFEESDEGFVLDEFPEFELDWDILLRNNDTIENYSTGLRRIYGDYLYKIAENVIGENDIRKYVNFFANVAGFPKDVDSNFYGVLPTESEAQSLFPFKQFVRAQSLRHEYLRWHKSYVVREHESHIRREEEFEKKERERQSEIEETWRIEHN